MAVIVYIEGAVAFTSSGDVMVTPNALDLGAEKTFELIQVAYEYARDPLLQEANMSSRNLLAQRLEGHWWLELEEYKQILREVQAEIEQIESNRAAKRSAMAVRRRDFDSMRARLQLQMLDAGVAYVCAHPDCGVTSDLTIDHITPLSRGGSDDLENLQFLCRVHNSAKGDRSAT